VSTSEGGWDNSVPVEMHFGTVMAGSAPVNMSIQLCNTGGSVLTITKSKPPSSPQLTATNPYGELLEGQKIDVGACAYGHVSVYPGTAQPNHPDQYISLTWTLNTDGLDALHPTQDFGVHDVLCDVTIVSRQVGPLLSDGDARYQWLGCFTDSNGRNLLKQVNSNAQEANNTNEQCQGLCYAQGYALAGTEYHQECWCGNSVAHPASYNNDSLNLCTFSCNGDTTEACGGDGGYISIYADTTRFNISAFLASLSGQQTTTISALPTTTTSATGTASSPGGGISTTPVSTTTTSAGPGSTLNPNEPAVVNGQWNYTGCYQDNVNNVRTLPSANTAANTMTLEACATFCSGYNYFGTEYGRECYCGYTLNITLKAQESDCSTPCAANANEICGTGNRLSVYVNNVTTTPPAVPAHIQQVGNYAWQGCYTEATTGRALSSSSYSNDNMTVESCASFCAGNGYQMMGIEYSRECYCGNTLGAGSVLAATSQCNDLCEGNAFEYCGGGSRLDLYSYAPAGSSSTTATTTTSKTSVVTTTTTATTTSTAASATVSPPTSSSLQVSTSNLAATSSTTRTTTGTNPSPTPPSSSTLSSTTLSPPTSSTTTTIKTATTTTTTTSTMTSPTITTVATATTTAITTTTTTTTSITTTTTTTTTTTKTTTTTTSPATTPTTLSSLPSSAPASTTTTLVASSSSGTSSGPMATPTNGYYYIGCFSDTSSGHALPQLYSNKSVTPEQCIAYANSVYSNAPSATTQMPYLFLEYHNQCYGGASLNFQGSQVSSLTGQHACTDVCSGSVLTLTATNGAVSTTTMTDNYCGGPKQFNLYALSTAAVAWPSTALPLTTVSA
jgi:iron transport multicopper oxidase